MTERRSSFAARFSIGFAGLAMLVYGGGAIAAFLYSGIHKLEEVAALACFAPVLAVEWLALSLHRDDFARTIESLLTEGSFFSSSYRLTGLGWAWSFFVHVVVLSVPSAGFALILGALERRTPLNTRRE